MTTDIYILGAASTAIGTFGGSLKDLSPTRTGTVAVREAIAGAGLSTADVDHSVFGNVIPTAAPIRVTYNTSTRARLSVQVGELLRT